LGAVARANVLSAGVVRGDLRHGDGSNYSHVSIVARLWITDLDVAYVLENLRAKMVAMVKRILIIVGDCGRWK